MTMVVRAGLVGVGYQGRSIDNFTADLAREGVTRLVDVRLTPLSRKPGFSKTALAQALSATGIAYEHRRELGNPRDNRAGFGGSTAELHAARAHFAQLLCRPESTTAIEDIVAAGERELVALLCFEADQERCHRDVVLAEAARRAIYLGG